MLLSLSNVLRYFPIMRILDLEDAHRELLRVNKYQISKQTISRTYTSHRKKPRGLISRAKIDLCAPTLYHLGPTINRNGPEYFDPESFQRGPQNSTIRKNNLSA